MQAQEKRTQLNEKAIAKLNTLLNEINNTGDYFRMEDGQSEEVTFNLVDTPGLKSRIIQTKDGAKESIKIVFIIARNSL